MLRFAGPIARYTVLEAARNRLLWLVAFALLAALAGAAFLGQIAITETARVQAIVIAAAMRLFAVFVVAAFVVTSMVREQNDKVLEVVLSKPLPRASYLFGKLAGFGTVAILLAMVVSLPLIGLMSVSRVLPWTLSLGCELLIVVAVALFCVLTLRQVVTALSGVLAFYLLARSIAALQIIAGATAGSRSWTDKGAAAFLNAIASLLPSLERFTQATWLVDGFPGWSALGIVLTQTAIYLALLTGASLFDLYRQDF
jgi:ABC-type transport system involved in multi-copper enzyme maturation permease subunit